MTTKPINPDEVFDAAHEFVMGWEGGFVDHPNDPGGATKYGVSLMFLKSLELIEADIDGDGDIDRDDILALTPENAKEIFKKYFWEKPGAYKLPSLISVCYYDLAVNAGTGRAAIVLQQAINTYYQSQIIMKFAGNLGPLTQQASWTAASAGKQMQLCNFYLDARADWYRKLAQAKPTSKVFLAGWLNRTDAMRVFVGKCAQQWGIER